MADEEPKRSYLSPEFEFDVGGKSMAEIADSMQWNYQLAKRKIKKKINQYNADKEYEKKNPKKGKEPGLGLGRTADLLEHIDD
jgi:hypothetical protein